MSVVQPQLVLMAAGDVNFTSRDGLSQWMATGKHSGREKSCKGRQMGGGGTGERGRGMLLGQAGDMDEDREHTAE